MKAGWKTKRVGELCDVAAGQSPEGRFYNSKGAGMPFYQGKKDFGEMFIKPASTWTTEITKTAREGDILMSVRAPVGPINFATEEICIGRGLASISAGLEIDRHFLFYQLLHLQPEISGKEGAVFASINKSEIEALPLVLPPLAEQKRIVALLDEAFAGIDAAKAKAEAKHDLSQELRESYLESLLTAEDDWTDTTVADCAHISTGFAFKSSGFSDSKTDIRLLGGDNIIAGAIRWENIRRWPKADAQNYQDFFLSIDDVVLAMDRPIVNTGLKISMISEEDVPALLIQRTARMRAKADVYPQFLYLTLSSKKFISYLSSSQKGVGVPHVSSRQIGSFGMKLPPRQEQHRIVGLLCEIDAATKDASRNMASMVNNLHELKSSLLRQAFAGELTA